MPAEMNVTSLYSPQADDDDIATLEKDLLLNMLIVVLLLISGPSFLAQADLAGQTTQTVQGEAVKIFIEDDGDLHLGSLTSAHITLETLPSALQNMVGADSTSVLVHHTATAPAGLVHAVLRAVAQVPRAKPLLALSEPSTLRCEKPGYLEQEG